MSMEPTDARDQADMERLIAGQDTALNDLMERHATPVFHFLCRMVGNEDDANDLAQETFVRVFKSRGEFPHEREIFRRGCSPSPRTSRGTISAGVRGIRTSRSKRKMRKRNRRWAARFRPTLPRRTNRRLPPSAPGSCAPPLGNCRRICARRLCCANGRN